MVNAFGKAGSFGRGIKDSLSVYNKNTTTYFKIRNIQEKSIGYFIVFYFKNLFQKKYAKIILYSLDPWLFFFFAFQIFLHLLLFFFSFQEAVLLRMSFFLYPLWVG